MKVLKRTLFASILAVIALVLAGYFMIRSTGLKNKLSRQSELLEESRNQLAWQDSLRKVDELLLGGEYTKALRVYDRLSDQNPSLEEEVSKRKEMVSRVRALQRQSAILADSLENKTVAEDTIQQSASLTPQEIRGYDSLLYALEKAQVESSYLRQQLREKTSGTYLTFAGRKGTTMHYVGQVSNDKANGRGIALLSTGSRYVGEWKNNMRHGMGTFYWPDGEYYEGEYQNDRRTGKGTYYWPSGEKFVGEWMDDERNGSGTFYGPEGEVVAQGVWKNDELVEMEKD